MCTATPDSVYAQNYTLCKVLIAQMARLCAQNQVRFEVAPVPLVYRGADVDRLRALDSTFDPLFWDRDLAVLADSIGFELVPLTEAFATAAGATGKLHWQHWNYAGHRLVARGAFPGR